MLSNLKLLEYSMFICITLLSILSCSQILMDDLHIFLHLSQHIRSNQHPTQWITPTDRSVTTPPIESLKWTHLQGFLIPIIIRKIHKWKIHLLLPLMMHENIFNISLRVMLIVSLCPYIYG